MTTTIHPDIHKDLVTILVLILVEIMELDNFPEILEFMTMKSFIGIRRKYISGISDTIAKTHKGSIV